MTVQKDFEEHMDKIRYNLAETPFDVGLNRALHELTTLYVKIFGEDAYMEWKYGDGI